VKKFDINIKYLGERSLSNRDLDVKVGQKPILSVEEEKALHLISLAWQQRTLAMMRYK